MRTRFRPDRGLTVRMVWTVFLLGLVYVLFVAALVAWLKSALAVMLIAGGLLLAQYWFSDKIALAALGARQVTPRQAPELHGLIDRLCATADMPKPRVAIADTDLPNAFATGRNPSAAVVAVTTGLMERLEQPEVEAVLAHELSHVRNRDVAVMTLASFFATLAQLLMRSFMWRGVYGGNRRDGGAAAVMLIYLASLAVWVISFFLIRALSRYRELAADRGAAIITGAPSQLASALLKISGTMQRIPTRDLREVEAMNAFFIVPALTGDALTELFSTHPSLERRLEQLKRLEQDMEGR